MRVKPFLVPALGLIVFAAGVGLLVMTQGDHPASRGSAAPVATETREPALYKDQVLVRNLTKQRMNYAIGPVSFRKKPEKKTLMPSGVDRRPAKARLLLTYERLGIEIKEVLAPGHAYCFRPDGNNLARLYPGSHMRDDAEDLAPFVATPPEVVDRMLDMARPGPADVVYDLGCGDGRVVIAAAKKFGSRGVGVDLDPRRIAEAESRAHKAGVQALVRFKVEDAMKTDISDATIVAVYLLPESNALLKPALDERLRPGALVVSHNYPFPGWDNKRLDAATVKDAAGREHTLFLYRR